MPAKRNPGCWAGTGFRPWYEPHIYAPGFHTDYGVKTLTGIREAIKEWHGIEADEQIRAPAATHDRFPAQIRKAITLLHCPTESISSQMA